MPTSQRSIKQGERKRGNPFVAPPNAPTGRSPEDYVVHDHTPAEDVDRSDGDEEIEKEAMKGGSRLLRSRSSAFRVLETTQEQRAANNEHDFIMRAAAAGSLHSSRAMHQSGALSAGGSLGGTLPSAGGNNFQSGVSRRSTGSMIQRLPDGQPDMMHLLDHDDTLRRAAFRIFDAYASMRCQMLVAVETAKENSIADDVFLDSCYDVRLTIADNIVFRTWSRAARLRANTLEHAIEAKEFVYEWYVQELERLAALVQMARKLRYELRAAVSSASVMVAEKTLCTVLDELRNTFQMTKKASLELQYRWEDIAAELREEVEMLTGIMVLAEKQAAYSLSVELDDFARNVEIQLTQKLEEAENVHMKVQKMRKQARKYISSDYTIVWKNTLIPSEAEIEKRRISNEKERLRREQVRAQKLDSLLDSMYLEFQTSFNSYDYPVDEEEEDMMEIIFDRMNRRMRREHQRHARQRKKEERELEKKELQQQKKRDSEKQASQQRKRDSEKQAAQQKLASTRVVVDNSSSNEDSDDDDYSYTYEYDVVDTESTGRWSTDSDRVGVADEERRRTDREEEKQPREEQSRKRSDSAQKKERPRERSDSRNRDEKRPESPRHRQQQRGRQHSDQPETHEKED